MLSQVRQEYRQNRLFYNISSNRIGNKLHVQNLENISRDKLIKWIVNIKKNAENLLLGSNEYKNRISSKTLITL